MTNSVGVLTDVPSLPAGVAERVPAELAARLIGLRHDLHRRPELAFEEHETAARLRSELARLGPAEVVEIGATGLVARFAGRDRGAPVVAVRGDIDALPVAEATGAPFASEIPGRMHACGHDVHSSWAVGAAALLAARPASGDVLVVFQPAEEVARGAVAVLESGALDGVAAVFGGHVDLRFPVGEAVAQAGPLAASADSFRIVLTGGGAHGARPHEAADPIVAGAAIVTALQTIVARRLAPGTPAVVTVGAFRAGVAVNVIPDQAELVGTLRAVAAETRDTLHREVERVARGVGEAHGVQVAVEIARGAPPLINPERGAGWAARAVRQVLGEEALRPFGITNLAGEDFAEYLERTSGCFLRIGARHAGDPVVPAHSPRFLPADAAVPIGAALLAEAARVASAELGGPQSGGGR